MSKSRYIPALDGLRTFAVAAVILYHLNETWLPCGLQGVTVFFVISGYLITGLLISEWNKTKTIDLPHFWLRRIRRLFPAIALVLTSVIILTAVFDQALLTKLRQDIVAVLCFVTNWFYIIRDVSYFDALGAPSPVTHFWSLAIEEQFYLVWPVLLLFLFRRNVKKRALTRGILVAIAVSAILMAVLYQPGADPSRVYYGTDTRAFALLIGAWLAFWLPASRVNRPESRGGFTRQQHLIISAAGIVSLALLVIMMVFLSAYSPFVYYGGTLLIAILTGIVIISLVDEGSPLARAFALPPLVWVGVRSYGIYLWHYPIILIIASIAGQGDNLDIVASIIAVAFTVGISALSYMFVEDPLRHGAIGKTVGAIRSGEYSLAQWVAAHAIHVVVAAALVIGAASCLAFVPDKSAIGDLKALQNQAENVAKEKEAQVAALKAKNAEARRATVILIGDSVSLRMDGIFQEDHPKGILDSAVGRQFSAGAGIYRDYLNDDLVGDVVVFALGNNGPISYAEVDELMSTVGSDKHVFFINTNNSTDWMSISNDAINYSRKYGNVEIIDWLAASSGHDEYFDGDGTHLTDDAARIYLDMIDSAIGPYVPADEAALIAAEKSSIDEIKAAESEAAEAHAAVAEAKEAVENYS